ncbi:MAG: ATP-binding protein [Candidatus Riflebacteria bacterium]|nr:ATP-binding protein [Candidatus Riflebacteria bacterium]
MKKFNRELDLSGFNNSAFLFGPRMTGKSTLLRRLDSKAYFDLLDPKAELLYSARPEIFWQEVSALPIGSLVVVDEIQRVPQLLNYVQMGIDRMQHIFLLSGSSARKLRRGGANLLGGRALDFRLHSLSRREIGDKFCLSDALSYGTLPKISVLITEKKYDLVRELLFSYVTTYIKEEIQAEAITRKIGSFQRFIAIAAQNNAQTIEFSNISRECSVPASTVKEYYQILDDTLIGFLLWPFDHSERKKSRPKAYFFDCGLIRALQNRLLDPPTPQETGFLFETWLINEFIKIRDYSRKHHELSFWRERDHEVDLLVCSGNKPILAVECKSGNDDLKPGTIKRFRECFPDTRLVVASMTAERKRLYNDIEVLPWTEVLEIYEQLKV